MNLYCKLCNCAVSCNKRFLVDSRRNTWKPQKAVGSRSEGLIPQTLQTFLRSRETDFVGKVTKAFLSASIPLYKLNNTHIKNLFRDNGHRSPFETTCRRTALHLKVVLHSIRFSYVFCSYGKRIHFFYVRICKQNTHICFFVVQTKAHPQIFTYAPSRARLYFCPLPYVFQ